jgi:hypothetical protein
VSGVLNADISDFFEMWEAWAENRGIGKPNPELLFGEVQKLI